MSLKEIVEDMKKELHKVKDEIINGELWCDNCHCFANNFVSNDLVIKEYYAVFQH